MEHPERLSDEALASVVNSASGEVGGLILELRSLVLKTAPSVCEAIRFHALCYFKADHPFGAIGGNVCMISPRGDHVRIEFIHGASLPDPERLLRGTAKAKRFVEIRSQRDMARQAIRDLIQSAVAYNPLATESQPGES